jgi:hypothetical protein
MKTLDRSAADRPRLACRVVQGWGSIVGDGAAPQAGALGARHVAECDCCRQFFAGSDALAAALRSTAANLREPAVVGLDRQIIAAVHRSSRPAEPVGLRRAASMMAWGGAVAVVTLAVIAVQKQSRPGGGAVRTMPLAAPVENTGEAADADDVWGRVQPKATALLEGAPLQREVDAVYADARAALGFLALNFLPSQSLNLAGEAETARPLPRPGRG